VITDGSGNLREHTEYFAFGETWVQEGASKKTPFMYTGKELDQETGLYYYGARYYDPRTSVWQSVDPILEKYLPSGDPEKDKNLPGMGGVFNSGNLAGFTYTHQNPVKYVDPDGNEISIDAFNSFVEETGKNSVEYGKGVMDGAISIYDGNMNFIDQANRHLSDDPQARHEGDFVAEFVEEAINDEEVRTEAFNMFKEQATDIDNYDPNSMGFVTGRAVTALVLAPLGLSAAVGDLLQTMENGGDILRGIIFGADALE